MSLLRTKSIEQSIEDTEEPEHQLRKRLSALDLTVFGVGVIIGTGIFVLTGVAAHDQAGPSVALAFVVAGIVCGLAAVCYAEFASTVPVAGSAYTFSYATLGELVAWIIGWDLILELALGASVVSVGWSQYLNTLLDQLGLSLPASINGGDDAVINIPAILIVVVLTGVAVAGIRLSARVTAAIVAIKVAIVLLVIFVGVFFIEAANFSPYIPPAEAPEKEGGLAAPLIQTLFAFMLVSAAVIILRRTRPELPRSFRVPLVPLIPILSILASLRLTLNLPGDTWLRFVIWLALGFLVYFGYSRRHSRIAAP